MKIVTERWMLVSPQTVGAPIIYNGFMSPFRKYLIRRAEKEFFGGTTWAHMRKVGWRAVKFKMRGEL